MRRCVFRATRKRKNSCWRVPGSSTLKWLWPSYTSATTSTSLETAESSVPRTIRGKADVEGKHKKQSGGHGQFGVCRIKMEPVERGKGVSSSTMYLAAPSQNWIPSVEKASGMRLRADTWRDFP